MALVINTTVVLRAMADNPAAFPASQLDLADLARKLLIKELKFKNLTLDGLKEICHFVLAENLQTLIDVFTAAELAGIVKKVDPHSPFAKSAQDSAGAREHIIALACGVRAGTLETTKESTAMHRPVKSTKSVTKPKIGDLLGSQVHSGKARGSRSKRIG